MPESLKFAISQTHDFLPPIALSQSGTMTDVVRLLWQPVNNARAYFMSVMSGNEAAGGPVSWWSGVRPRCPTLAWG